MSYFVDGRCLTCGGSMLTDGSCGGKCTTATDPTATVSVPSVFKLLTLDERAVSALERIAAALEGGAVLSHSHGYGRCMPVPQSPHGA